MNSFRPVSHDGSCVPGHSSRPKDRARTGLVMMGIVVCLVVTMLIVGLVMKQLVQLDRHQRSEERLVQADAILRSAFDRARKRIQAQPEYRGETWEIPAESLPAGPARVEISIESTDDSTHWNTTVHVRYPTSFENPVQRVLTRPIVTSSATTAVGESQ